MEITGIDVTTFRQIVSKVGLQYEANLRVHPDVKPLSRNRIRARVDVYSSRGKGARRSWSGRRLKAACWHAYRDVLAELFRVNPAARVKTALALYEGQDGFQRNYPATGYVNVGSMMQPAYMPELCECGGALPSGTAAAVGCRSMVPALPHPAESATTADEWLDAITASADRIDRYLSEDRDPVNTYQADHWENGGDYGE